MDEQSQKLRLQLYKMVRNQAESRLGEPSLDLKHYRAAFDHEFSGPWASAGIEDLLEGVASADVVLLGDFHGIKQSQKSHLRLLKKLKTHRRKLVMALECLEVKDTPWLKKYLDGKISEEKFLRTVKWDQRWGFPWDHYKPLIEWVHEQGGSIFGVNKASMRVNRHELQTRDKVVAKNISDLLVKNPDAMIVVIFGEMHLAKNHLVRHLSIETKRKKIRPQIVRIFQNPENLYFKFLAKTGKIPQVVQKNKHTFALLNVPPWVKWQSYLLYLEQFQDSGLHFDDEWDDEESWDFSDEVAQMARILANDLKLKFKEDHLAVATLNEGGFESSLQKIKDGKTKRVLRAFIRHEIPFVVPGTNMIYLPRMSVNHAAQAAMLFLVFSDHKDLRKGWQLPSDFLKLIWIFSWIYFGSKLINPRRKTDTFKDLKIRLASQDEKGRGKEALRLALWQKSRELSGRLETGKFKGPPGLKPNPEALIIAAELLGKIHGEKLYAGWVQRRISRLWIQRSLKSPLKTNNLGRTYYRMVKALEGVSLDFTSKVEKI